MVRLTKQEQESIIITFVISLGLMLMLIFLTYHPAKEVEEKEEPVELMLENGGGGGGGAEINFGQSGDGAKFQGKVSESSAQPVEEVVGSNDDKAEAVANTKPVKVRDPLMQNSKPQVDKTPKKPTNSALDNLLGGSDTGSNGNGTGVSQGTYGRGGTGNGTGGGTGSGNGTGTGPGSGSGSGGGSGAGRGTGVGDYNLGGRKALGKPKPLYTCNEEGKVVVQVVVDKNGRVVSATPGIRGTTNPAKCLLDQARVAAMETTWEASPTNAERQTGTIAYNFKLTE